MINQIPNGVGMMVNIQVEILKKPHNIKPPLGVNNIITLGVLNKYFFN